MPADAVAEMKAELDAPPVSSRLTDRPAPLDGAGQAIPRRATARMLKSRRNEVLVALVLVAPFVAIYGWLFIYPTIQMVRLSFTNAPLIGAGDWVGFDNYVRAVRRQRVPDRGLEHRPISCC